MNVGNESIQRNYEPGHLQFAAAHHSPQTGLSEG